MSKLNDNTTPGIPDQTEEISVKASNDADAALDSFLSRESTPQKPKKPVNRKFNRNMIILLAAVIVIAVLTGVIITLNNQPYPQSTEDLYVEAFTIASLDEVGQHEVIVPTNSGGDPQQNGSGTLIDYVPSLIESIRVENSGGSFTVLSHTHEGEATEYMLKGFESFSLQTGVADAVANDASNLLFLTIAGVGKDLSAFGLDTPRATVSVTFTDGTSARILVGNEAAASAGTYVAFGNRDAVYLVADDAVDAFFYTPADFISLAITDSPDTTDNAAFKRIAISGSHYPGTIVLEPNTDTAVNYYYRTTQPREMFADAVMSADIAGSIRGLYAENVVAVNADGSDTASFLAPYGLSGSGYAEVIAEYPDTTIRLRASAPDSEGYVNLVNLNDPVTGGKVIYQIQIGAVSWASASVDALIPDTVLSVSRTAIGNITLTADGKTYSIDVDTKTQEVTNTDGDTEEVTTTEAYLDDKRLGEDSFLILYQNLSQLPNKGLVDSDSPLNTKLLEIRYTYTTGRSADTLVLYDDGSGNIPVALNGVIIGSTPRSYANALIGNLSDIASGKLPESL